MDYNDNLPASVSIYYSNYLFVCFILSILFVPIWAWSMSSTVSNPWEYSVLLIPIFFIVVALAEYKKNVYPYAKGAKNGVPFLKFDKNGVTLLGVSIHWSVVKSIEILTIPAGRAGDRKFLFVDLKEDIQSLNLASDKLKRLTQSNSMLAKYFGLEGTNFLSLCPVKFLTLSVDEIEALADAYMNAAKCIKHNQTCSS